MEGFSDVSEKKRYASVEKDIYSFFSGLFLFFSKDSVGNRDKIKF